MSTGAEVRRKPVIGLTGGIGSGKSLVARQLASLGCAVIDADELAARVLQEPAVREQLRGWWGDGILDSAGRVNRSAVARVVFSHATELGRLESVIHPRVHALRAQLRARHEADAAVLAIVEDTPLLLEKGLAGQCDYLIFVDAARDVREQRVRQTRGWSGEDLQRRESMQWPLDKKRQRADYVVSNNGDPAECLLHVRQVLSQILHQQGGGRPSA